MIRGHYAYYGISGNIKRLRWYAYQVVRIWKRWLSRRDRRRRLHWDRLNDSSRVTHCQQPGSSIGTQPRAKLFREEPEAGNLHIQVCEDCALKARRTQPSEMAAAAKPSEQPRTKSCVAFGNDRSRRLSPSRTTCAVPCATSV
jgi:hypothetical protein